METQQSVPWMKVAEIEIAYKNHVKAKDRPVITTPRDIYRLLERIWDNAIIELQEQFKVIYLNKSNRVLGLLNHSTGSIDSVNVDKRIIIAVALKCAATRIILAHNHPSGGLQPSTADLKVTKDVKEAANLFDIQVLDHVIIGSLTGDYYSMTENGVL